MLITCSSLLPQWICDDRSGSNQCICYACNDLMRMPWLLLGVKVNGSRPVWVAQLVGASSHKPKRLQVRSRQGAYGKQLINTSLSYGCFSPSLFHPLSLEINKKNIRSGEDWKHTHTKTSEWGLHILGRSHNLITRSMLQELPVFLTEPKAGFQQDLWFP